MNCAADEDITSFFRNPDNNDSESSENFQKYITELFERNGILNDLRAYLRGHIVDVLKSAETGATPTFQKHFTQRLELVYQSLNILIAEYLLRLDFSYSLSVYLSEMPLANMVFDFAKNLLKITDSNVSGLRFNENDVWSVLHYLGLKCDSLHASKIINLYKHGDFPLLHCILKCFPMYHKEPSCLEEAITSDECLSSSAKSAESQEYKRNKRKHKNNPPKCKHYGVCKSCQSRLARLREKYKNRKMKMQERSEKRSSINALDVQSLMNSVGVMEKGLIDEMFQQLKTVYETEVDIMKEEEERRIKRSIANHAIQLQKHREEMEESFRARAAELERNVHQKKKFLWGLARALRSQHEHMTLAMRDVQYETKRLAEKESGIKMQLDEAEQMLKNRGEDMRNQISQELIVLEGHLETMKKERESINKERDDLENLKSTYENNSKIKDSDENFDFKTHYNTLKDEIVILRNYIESAKESKCLVERGTVMDLGEGVMNNSVGVKSEDDDDKLKGSQVINDLKKQKNVNFSQQNLDEIYRQLSRTPSRSIDSVQENSATHTRESDLDFATHSGGYKCDSGTNVVTANESAQSNHGCDGCRSCNRNVMLQLREENVRLKAFARQQRDHIDALSRERERLQTHLLNNSRPRTAPSVLGSNFFSANRFGTLTSHRVNPTTSADAFGWRKGAGEELSLFSTGEPRVILPGEAVPFIGVLRDRHIDSRRHLISQWRALRRRLSTQTQPRPTAPMECSSQLADHDQADVTPQVSHAELRNGESTQPYNSDKPQRIRHAVDKPREKSPKSLLREAKKKLKNNNTKEPPAPRDKSPNAVLREAKMRLRKLEIEAEAVEKSYLDFRKRQSELRDERQNLVLAESSLIKSANQLQTKPSKSLQRLNAAENTTNTFDFEKSTDNMKKDFDKYLREYQTNFDIGQIYFQNKNSAIQRIKPIPSPYNIYEENEEPKSKNTNYLETPLTEFRKLYQTQNKNKRKGDASKNPIPIETVETETPKEILTPESEKTVETKSEKNRRETIHNVTSNKKAELELLKQNISKIYNIPQSSTPNETGIDIPEIIVSPTNTKIDNQEELDENEVIKENKLVLQVENVRETSNVGVTESKQKLLLVVESSVDNRETSSSENENEKQNPPTQMTIIVSPKGKERPTVLKSPRKELTNKSAVLTSSSENGNEEQNPPTQMTIIVSPKGKERPTVLKSPRKELTNKSAVLTASSENENEEQNLPTQMTIIVSPKGKVTPTVLKSPRKELSDKSAVLTNNEPLNSILQTENNLTSDDMKLDLTEDRFEHEVEKDPQEEYVDDFSADVDNYYNTNSLSDGGRNSPISLPKTSEDENFWEN